MTLAAAPFLADPMRDGCVNQAEHRRGGRGSNVDDQTACPAGRYGIGGARGVTFRLKSGIATAPTLRQSEFRLGGIGTVRGHDYGERRGQAFWAGQIDVAPVGVV